MFVRLCFVFVITASAVRTSTVEYYQEIWDENIAKIDTWSRPTRNSEFDNYQDTSIDIGNYDFIVVGGGSSGAAVAARLSEVEKWKVLLLDAGGNETEFSLMPGAFFPIQMSNVNWGYLTTPQEKACFGCKNKQCDFARGKVLGGGSAINAMLFVRGNSGDFDDWCGPHGNKGWCYEDVLPYFRKMENATSITGGKCNKFRGNDGPLSVTLNNPTPSYARYILDGSKELRLRDCDYNGKIQINTASHMQVTVKHGRRHSSNQAYLQPVIKQRSNLKVLTNALAVKIIVETGTPNKAKQIKFIRDGKTYVANVTNELILSAGAVNSPQLLMLSGIGPKSELEKHDIKLISDLPVGENLEDHPTVFNILIDTNLTAATPSFRDLLAQYTQGKGTLTYTYGQEVGFSYASNNTEKGVPDVEYIMFQGNNFNRPEWVYKQANYDRVMNASLMNQRPNAIIMHIMVLHPKSRGWVKLNSNDPIDFPIINPNYLESNKDVVALLNAIDNFEKLLETSTFKSINASLSRSNIEPCDSLNGREYWDCYIRHKLSGIFHPVSTCRMGNDTKTSVVDKNLKVHGFQNLRVVDASAFPTSTSGHPNAVCIMMAEKISAEIKN